MTFYGYGVIWNPKENKCLVNFNIDKFYHTNNPDLIALLKACPNITRYEKDSPAHPKEEVHEDLIIPLVDNEAVEEQIETSVIEDPQESNSEPVVVFPDEPTKEELYAQLDILGISYKKTLGIAKLKALLAEHKG